MVVLTCTDFLRSLEKYGKSLLIFHPGKKMFGLLYEKRKSFPDLIF